MVVSLRNEEVSFQLIKLLKKLYHFNIPFFFNLWLTILWSLSLSNLNAFEFTIINVPEHNKSFSWDVLNLLNRVIPSFAVLIHDVFAKAIVPWLQFVVQNLVHQEVTFNVAISVETGALIVHYNVVAGVYIAVAEINSIVHAVPYYIVFKFAATPCQNNQSRPNRSSNIIMKHRHLRFLFHNNIGILIFNYFVIFTKDYWLGVEI